MITTPRVPKQRLDQYLTTIYPDISRAFLQKLCSTDQVLVNGVPQKSGFKLKPTDQITVLYDMNNIEKIEDIDLPILYQDSDVVVVNKPAGVISHSRGRYWNEPSVASFVRQITKQPGERAGIVHRLDRATSGVMICAKNQVALSYLQQQFANKTTQKTYIAIVKGHMEPVEAIIDMPIERNPKEPSKFRVGSNGKTAQTKYKVIGSSKDYDEVQLEPATGRTHQLRVHLKQQGHSIIGDTFYDGEDADRLYLHAHKLTIQLPGDLIKTFVAPMPEEFNMLLKHD